MNFFEITRYNLQQIILEKEMVDLYYMLIQMSDEFYPILASHGNTITLHAQEDLTVYADPTKLARVFNNILKNAIAYSYPNTDIQITAVKTEEEIRISVCNHGKTIPQQRLESIFEKFFAWMMRVLPIRGRSWFGFGHCQRNRNAAWRNHFGKQ